MGITYKIMALLLVIVVTSAASAQNISVLYNFGTNRGDPAHPYGPGDIVQGRDGNLYGTSTYGGSGKNGTVFRVDPNSGNLKVLYRFDITHGQYPSGGLSLGPDGNLYGTTVFGGSSSAGVIYRITPHGEFVVLYNFTGGSDGSFPYAPPLPAADGNFYGTSGSGANGFGTIYKMTPSGTVTTIHQFIGTDGSSPHGRLLRASDGNFYGTTLEGGALSQGVIFRISSSGQFTVLFSFDVIHGNQTPAGLIQSRDGNLYGTTTYGGINTEGIVYKMTLNGTFSVIHNFGAGDGTHPPTSLVEGTDGGLYGLTLNDGAKGLGTVYRITPSGSFSIVQNFERTSGDESYVALTQHTSGVFYGDTVYGGSLGLGTFYSYDAGLPPFIGFIVGAGRVGGAVGILGQGFTGTTSVTFDGVPAAFNVQSDTYLTAIVPTGAATGPVTVLTPGSMLRSKEGFRVLP